MIELHYFEYEKIEILRFYTTAELVKHLAKLSSKKHVWLATEDGENGEIIITESIDTLISAVNAGVFNLLLNGSQPFFLQQYDSYEDAYAVALDMREGNPRCYCKES